MAEEKKIQLPYLPQGEYYEDFVAALLCAGGYYIEKRINLRAPINILELDLVTSKYDSKKVDKTLCEIKSGEWGFPDIFKVKGWMDFLQLQKASFVCLNNKKTDFTKKQEVAKTLNIDLVEIIIEEKKIKEKSLLEAYEIKISDEKLYKSAASAIRFALSCERIMITQYFKPLAKNPNAHSSYKYTDRFLYTVCEQSFFQHDAHERIKEVFGAFTKYQNLTARMDKEMETDEYPNEGHTTLSPESFKELFYKCPPTKSPLHIALYAELMCRMIILQLCVEESFRNNDLKNIVNTLKNLSLPNNIKTGIDLLKKDHNYYYLYPHFWQIFIYVFGGFILKEKEKEEYKMLSILTNIPPKEIPKALEAFDVLFPLKNKSWLYTTKSNITILQFMPLQLSGVGANFRRFIHMKGDKQVTYEDLGEYYKFKSQYTLGDLIKYNNLLIEYLCSDKNIQQH